MWWPRVGNFRMLQPRFARPAASSWCCPASCCPSKAGVVAEAYAHHNAWELNGSKHPSLDLRDTVYYIIVRFRGAGSCIPFATQLAVGTKTLASPIIYRLVHPSGSTGFGVSWQSEKFLFEQSRKFLLTASTLEG